jgi:uncharacterized HAD superfamily protein
MEKQKKDKIMKIGIDIDDVLLHSLENFLGFYNNKFDETIKKEHCVSDKRFHECLGITKEDLISLYKEYEKLEIPIEVRKIEGAEEVLRKIKTKCDFILITARPKSIEENTYKVLNKNYPNHNFKIIFTNKNNKKISKGDICIKNNISLMIDDDWKNALDCVKKNICVLLLDKRWNRGIKHKKILRVFDWNEIFEKINKFNKNKILINN